MHACAHKRGCGNFCAHRCRRCFENVRADLCGRARTWAAHPQVHFSFVCIIDQFKFSEKKLKKKLKKFADSGACAAHYQDVCDVRACATEKPRTLKVWEMETLKAKTPRVRLTPLCLQKRLREFKINFPTKLNTKQFYKN